MWLVSMISKVERLDDGLVLFGLYGLVVGLYSGSFSPSACFFT